LGTLSCPFYVGCQFYSCTAKWPSDVVLRQLYCTGGGYAACEVAKQKLAGQPLPKGAFPAGNISGKGA